MVAAVAVTAVEAVVAVEATTIAVEATAGEATTTAGEATAGEATTTAGVALGLGIVPRHAADGIRGLQEGSALLLVVLRLLEGTIKFARFLFQPLCTSSINHVSVK